MRITRKQLRRIIREVKGSTPKYDSDSALTGGQSTLPDRLQLAIIDKVVQDREEHEEEEREEKNEISEGMQYHFDAGVGFDKNIYRPGSKEFFKLFVEARRLYRSGNYKPKSTKEYEILEFHDIGEFGTYQGDRVPLDFPMNESDLDEAKYKGREVTLGAKGAQKGDGGRSYVYVRDPDDGKVKKVSFGSSMPDAMGDSEAHKDRRKNYGTRHACAKKKDKMAAGYWSCRVTKMFGKSIPGWW